MTMRTLILAVLLAIAAPLAAQTLTIPVDYRLGPGDIITVEVLNENDLTKRNVRIDTDGTFEYPYLDRVDAKGKTKREVQEYIQTKLVEKDVVLRPQVSVEVDAMRQRFVLMLGEIRNPGKIQMMPTMTLLDALTQAGMPLATAGSRVLIQRKVTTADGSPTGEVVNLPDINLNDLLMLKTEANPDLKEDDRISISKAEKFYVSGQVKSSGEQTWEPGMIVRTAILKAGGISEKGSSRRIKIIRIVKGKETKVDVEMTTPVQPGDTIEVGQKLL
jgi:polysaccharide export outer membrane protein